MFLCLLLAVIAGIYSAPQHAQRKLAFLFRVSSIIIKHIKNIAVQGAITSLINAAGNQATQHVVQGVNQGVQPFGGQTGGISASASATHNQG